MDKRFLHHIRHRLHAVSPWLLAACFIATATISVMALRRNNLEMVRLRETVAKADEQNGDVEGAIKALREHVYAHMNTDLTGGDLAIYPPIQLKYRYERLVAAERERVAAINSRVYTEAQADCERRFPTGLSISGRVPCVQEYVAAHGAKEQPIPDALYKFDFVSPRWSPDLAGFSLVAAALFLALLIVRLAADWWLKNFLKHHS